ncbi:hypothetical protein Droror1_Dr00023439 [Drosera rotundifolia]
MAQKREQEETLDLKAPSNCPDTNTQTCAGPRPDPTRLDRLQPDPDLRQPQNRELGEDTEELAAARRVVAVAVNRCWGCGKRVGLVSGFRCRCGELFCAQHRYSDKHDCGFDYKAAGRAAIARENPVVRASKLLKV